MAQLNGDAVSKPIELIASSAERLSKSVLGSLALFLLLIYFISGVTLIFSSLSERSQTILVLFVTLFPLVILLVFYRLVTKHFGKVIDPGSIDKETYSKIVLALISAEAEVKGRGEEEGFEAVQAQKSVIVASESAVELSHKKEIVKILDWYSPDWRQKRYLFRRASENFREQPEIVFSDAKIAKDVTSVFGFIDNIGASIAEGELKDADVPIDFKRSASRYGRRGATWLAWLREKGGNAHLFENFEAITSRWAIQLRDGSD